jgi:arginine decarboxylase-like protein
MDQSSQTSKSGNRKKLQEKKSDTRKNKLLNEEICELNSSYKSDILPECQKVNVSNQIRSKVAPYKTNLSLYEKIQVQLEEKNVTNKIMDNLVHKRSQIRDELKKLRRRARKNMQNILHDHSYTSSQLHFPSSYTGIVEHRHIVEPDSEIDDLLAEIM